MHAKSARGFGRWSRVPLALLVLLVPLMTGCGSSGDASAADDASAPPTDDASQGDGLPPPKDSSADGSPSDSRLGDSGLVGEAGDAAPSPSGRAVGAVMGLNAFIDDPLDVLAPLGVVREYHDWGWLADDFASGPAYPDMKYTFMAFNGWDWDAFFGGLAARGSSGFPAVQGGVPWLAGGAVPPVAAGADKTAAASYVAHADVMFQLAARYGATKIADAKLKLRADQTRSTGLGTVQYFEDFNEQDLVAGFTAEAFAAMASADYDGDQGRLGATFGVKAADPTAKLVMGGLSGAYDPSITWVDSITKFLDGMRGWASAHRGGSFPADVINVHYYSFGPKGAALSPEDDKVQDKLAAIVAYRDAHLPDKEVWWTEFGYDTFDRSPLHAPAIGGNSAFVVQGQWLVRAVLAGLAAHVDRATLFVSRDSCHPDDAACKPETQFATCGVTTVKGEWAKKPSWYFLATLRARLGAMVFAGEKPSGAADVRILSFRDPGAAKGALVVWSPTSTGATHAGYALPVPAGPTSATRVTLADKQDHGVESTLPVAGGHVTLDVSETPSIVLLDAVP